MPEVSERIELLINRYLDGAITADQQIELDKALRINAEARRMLEDYQTLDRCAVEVIRESIASRAELVPGPMRLAQPRSMRWARWMWYVPGAVAACLAAAVWLSQPNSTHRVADLGVQPRIADVPINKNVSSQSQRGKIVPAAHQLGFEDQALDRDAIWYVAKNGQVYLIQRQMAHVSKRPSAESQVWLAAGGI